MKNPCLQAERSIIAIYIQRQTLLDQRLNSTQSMHKAIAQRGVKNWSAK